MVPLLVINNNKNQHQGISSTTFIYLASVGHQILNSPVFVETNSLNIVLAKFSHNTVFTLGMNEISAAYTCTLRDGAVSKWLSVHKILEELHRSELDECQELTDKSWVLLCCNTSCVLLRCSKLFGG